MQLLIFHLDADRYAMRTAEIVCVLPLTNLKQLPHTPAYVAGLLNYHGAAVPVIDLCHLMCGRAANALFDSRIILINYQRTGDSGKTSKRLGLIAEHVSALQQRNPDEFSVAGIDPGTAPYLGKIATDREGILQLVDLDQLLSESVRAMLFPLDGALC